MKSLGQKTIQYLGTPGKAGEFAKILKNHADFTVTQKKIQSGSVVWGFHLCTRFFWLWKNHPVRVLAGYQSPTQGTVMVAEKLHTKPNIASIRTDRKQESE